MKNLKKMLVLILLTALILACGVIPQPQATSVPASIYDSFYQRNDEEGMAAIEEFLKSNPDHAEALALRGGFNVRLVKDAAALADANRAIELNPDLALGYAVRAWVYSFAEGKESEMKADLEQALQLDPNLALIYTLRGRNYMDAGELDKAQADFEHALELRPDYVSPKIGFGDVFFAQEKFEDAIKQYDAVLELVANDGYILHQRALAKLNLGDNAGAVVDSSAAIEADNGQYADDFFIRALAYEALGEPEKALADYEKAIEIGPDDSRVLNGAAYLIATQENGDYNKAMEYANKALELEDPDEPNTLDTQAFIYYRLGEYEKALAIFIAVIDAGETYSYYGRGLTYEAMGEKDKAISDFKAFLEAHPDDRNSAEVKQHLEALGAK